MILYLNLDYSVINLIKDAPLFDTFLKERHIPIDKNEINSIRSKIIDQMEPESIIKTSLAFQIN